MVIKKRQQHTVELATRRGHRTMQRPRQPHSSHMVKARCTWTTRKRSRKANSRGRWRRWRKTILGWKQEEFRQPRSRRKLQATVSRMHGTYQLLRIIFLRTNKFKPQIQPFAQKAWLAATVIDRTRIYMGGQLRTATHAKTCVRLILKPRTLSAMYQRTPGQYTIVS